MAGELVTTVTLRSAGRAFASARFVADLHVTVVTNSPAIATELLRHPLCEVIITGGQIQRASGGSVGATAAGQIQGIIFDQAFIGGCAMDPQMGLTFIWLASSVQTTLPLF